MNTILIDARPGTLGPPTLPDDGEARRTAIDALARFSLALANRVLATRRVLATPKELPHVR